jgi:indole-3-glycerol phosphate synthase
MGRGGEAGEGAGLTMAVLDAILEAKRREIAELAATPARNTGTARGPRVVATLRRSSQDPLRLITEIKRRSPSAGPLSTALTVAERAIAYAQNGAAMISVLCDRPFFDGGFEHLAQVRAALDDAGLAVPLLAKEFVLEARQIDEAAANGADAVLLIARIVSAQDLGRLVARARALRLEPLVEVVTEAEVDVALAADASVIGVNARDLDTLVMDRARAERVLAAIPKDRVALHLSGLKGPEDVATVARTRVDGALIGEALMRQDDPSEMLRAMVAASFAPKTSAP